MRVHESRYECMRVDECMRVNEECMRVHEECMRVDESA